MRSFLTVFTRRNKGENKDFLTIIIYLYLFECIVEEYVIFRSLKDILN